jgi:hypothetical protein
MANIHFDILIGFTGNRGETVEQSIWGCAVIHHAVAPII